MPAPHPAAPHEDPSAQSLMIWLAIATLVVTVAVAVAAAWMSATGGMIVAYGTLLVAAVGVWIYVLRFIGPEG